MFFLPPPSIHHLYCNCVCWLTACQLQPLQQSAIIATAALEICRIHNRIQAFVYKAGKFVNILYSKISVYFIPNIFTDICVWIDPDFLLVKKIDKILGGWGVVKDRTCLRSRFNFGKCKWSSWVSKGILGALQGQLWFQNVLI